MICRVRSPFVETVPDAKGEHTVLVLIALERGTDVLVQVAERIRRPDLLRISHRVLLHA
jgi:hypothetical protein